MRHDAALGRAVRARARRPAPRAATSSTSARALSSAARSSRSTATTSTTGGFRLVESPGVIVCSAPDETALVAAAAPRSIATCSARDRAQLPLPLARPQDSGSCRTARLASMPMPRTFLSGADLVLPDRDRRGQHARHRRRPHRRHRVAARARSAPASARFDLQRTHRSCPASSTCTSTASRARHARRRRRRRARSRRGCRATASRRSARRRWRARRRRSRRCSARSARRATRRRRRARVLPAHLESNFINPEYRGAQPLECLRASARGARRRPDARRQLTSRRARSST